MTFTDWGPVGPALALLAMAGVVASYLLLRREMRSELKKLREMIEQHPVPASEVGATEIPEKKPVSPVAPAPAATTALPVPSPAKSKPTVTLPKAPVQEEITPEILAVIAAAVAQFIGAGARIRSTRLLTSPMGISPWAQQGRVIIQASHNLGAR